MNRFSVTLINDIKAAQTSCHLEFYIWEAGGLADELLETVLEAHERGIHIRILLDAVGSKNFLRGEPSQTSCARQASRSRRHCA